MAKITEKSDAIALVAVTVAIIGFVYYVIRGVTASHDLTRLLPHLGMSLGVFAMGVHFLIRSRHERGSTVFLNTACFCFASPRSPRSLKIL